MKKLSILFLILCMFSFVLPVNARTIRKKGRPQGRSSVILRHYPMPVPYLGNGTPKEGQGLYTFKATPLPKSSSRVNRT